MSTIRRALTVTAFVVIASGLAFADSITCTGPSDVATELGASNLISCPGFTVPVGDTITSEMLVLTGSIDGSGFANVSTVTLTNSSTTSSETGSGTSNSGFYLDASSSLPGVTLGTDGSPCNVSDTISCVFNVNAPTGPVTLGPSASSTIDVSGLFSPAAFTIAPADYSDYASPISFAFDTYTQLILSGGGGFFGGSQSTYADVSAVIDYTLAPTTTTPEPTTMALMGGVLVGLGLLRKRYTKS